jgi:pilus assembly protein CpaC
MERQQTRILPFILLAFIGLGMSGAGYAQQEESTVNLAARAMQVPLYKSQLIRLTGPAARVSVGNPDVADILILRASQLYVLGKDLGTTNVLLWDKNDNLVDAIEVEVTHDLRSLKKKLYDLLPNEKIEVRSAQRNIILSGNVSNVTNMDAALKIARGYFAQFTAVDSTEFEQEGASASEVSSGEVINLMTVGGVQQVMLEVKVAEISRTELRRLDVRFNSILNNSSRWAWGAVNGGATFPDAVFPPNDIRIPVFDGDAPLGPVIDEFAPNDLSIADKGFFASLLTENALFNVAFDAAKENGLAKVLAEPTLTTQTGQVAEFLSGGEFPIPVPQGGANNAVTIEFKEFGVGVKFVPVVLDNGRINLKLNISVSELVSGNTVGIEVDGVTSSFIIPALTKRSAVSTVELADGQTIGIAGLINENLREVVTKFPGLGSIPVIGALFRSQEFIKGETELLILVTPHLASPIGPRQVRLPTEGFAEPSDFSWFLLGRTEGRGSQTDTNAVRSVMSSQIHDSEAASAPSLEPVTGGDPTRLEAVMEDYRGNSNDVSKMNRPGGGVQAGGSQ